MKTQNYLLMALIICTLALCADRNIHASDATWRFQYAVPDRRVTFNETIPVSTGGYVGVGDVWDASGDTAHNAFISRFDQTGQVLWSTSLTFPLRRDDYLRSVVETADGGFIATGRTLLDGVTEHGAPTLISAVLIVKITADGSRSWSKLIKNFANNSSYGAQIKRTIDGNYIIVGQSIAYKWNDQYKVYTNVTGGALILKIDSTGNVLFNRVHYGDWIHSWAWTFYDVVQDGDGNYYALGYATGEAYSEAIGWGGMLLAKLDSTGAIVWANKLDYAQQGQAVGISEHGQRLLYADNALYVTGILGASATLSRYTSAGARLWTKQYMCNRAWDAGIGAVEAFVHSADGHFLMVTSGGCNSIMKITRQGDVLWGRAIHGNFHPNSLLHDSDGNLLVGGWASGTADGTIAVISKYDRNGYFCETTADIDYSVADIEMLTNAVPHNLWVPTAVDNAVPVFSGPTLTAATYCSKPAGPAFVPSIEANGADDQITINSTSPVTISVSLNAGADIGLPADWWLVQYGADGSWYSLNLATMKFEPNLHAMFQYNLINFGKLDLLKLTDLAPGAHLFIFALDTVPNGLLDVESLAFDMVTVNTTEN